MLKTKFVEMRSLYWKRAPMSTRMKWFPLSCNWLSNHGHKFKKAVVYHKHGWVPWLHEHGRFISLMWPEAVKYLSAINPNIARVKSGTLPRGLVMWTLRVMAKQQKLLIIFGTGNQDHKITIITIASNGETWLGILGINVKINSNDDTQAHL